MFLTCRLFIFSYLALIAGHQSGQASTMSSGAMLAIGTGSSSGARDTLITNCEVYLRGRYVQQVERAGKRGHVISRSETAVLINGHVYFDATVAPRSSPDSLIGDAVRVEAAIRQSVRNEVRSHRVEALGSDSMRVGERVYRTGESTIHSYTDQGVPVEVAYYPDRFVVTYRELKGYYPYNASDSPGSTRSTEQRVDACYRDLVLAMMPGKLIVAGEGYRTAVGAGLLESAKQAIAQIPHLAKKRSAPDVYGDDRYEPLEVGTFSFSAAEVRDFVNAARAESKAKER